MAQKPKIPAPPAARPKPDRFLRVVILAWTVAGVILLTTLFRVLKAVGLFSFAGTVSPVCQAIALPGPGDLAYESKSATLFIAANGLGKTGGIYVLTPGSTKPVKLAGTAAGIRPVALSIGYDLTGAPTLAVVDRKAGAAAAVELYGVSIGPGGPSLTYQSTIQGGLARRGDGVAALGNGRFYLASNPTHSDALAWADRWLMLDRADLLFFNGMLFREAVNGLSDPSGVAVSPDGARVFVASRNERRLIAFSREPYTGALSELDSISLPLRPDRVSVDASGTVWVAGPTRLPALSPDSTVVRVFLGADGKTQSLQTVYAGEGIKAASAAVKAGNHLFIGSSRDGKLLDCAVK